MNSPFVVAVIPAKMTSERFPEKNLADLCGYPLVYYSIRVAQLVPSIDSVYVSSESTRVLEVATEYAATPIRRPNQLSVPSVTTQDVLKHAFKWIVEREDQKPDLVVLLQPTHPIRLVEPMNEAVQAILKQKAYDCLFAVSRTYSLRGKLNGQTFVPEFPLPRNKKREPIHYKNTGSFYIFRPERSFLKHGFFGKKIFAFELNHIGCNVDIDIPEDMNLAKAFLEANQTYFSFFIEKHEIRSSG